MEASSATMAISAAAKTTAAATTTTLLSPPNPNSSLFFNLRPHKSPIPKTLCCIHSPHKPNPNPNPNSSPFSCSAAVTFSPPQTTSDVSAPPPPPLTKLRRLAAEFESLTEPMERFAKVLSYSDMFPRMEGSSAVDSNRVMGCTARVWLTAAMDGEGRMRFAADSDSDVTRGFCNCLVSIFDRAAPEAVLEVKTEDLAAVNVGMLIGGERSRANTWHNVLVAMQKKTRALVAARGGEARGEEEFPSLVIASDGIQARGSYAETQARFLFPDEAKIQELVSELKEKEIGVVAHFYMDPEVQGVLTAAQKQWPHIHISDSLVMADSAVNMAKAGCKFIAVLGVDFMSENVRAILDQAGFSDVGVYRMSNERIGCSLAEAASSPAYMNYLEAASKSHPSLHVVYINTSLETKAFAHELVPTITCTSSNVVQTILQAFAQVPDLEVYYGPDSYMGANIAELLQQMAKMTDEEIAEIHPEHNRDSVKSLLPRLKYYQDGTCIVHHLFGREVVEKINEMYSDAFLTAHFEVPGEMFSLAMEAKRRGMGVVGSTQNILDFIKQRVQESLDRNVTDHLQFVLGTESGMVTSIVAAVRNLLNSSKNGDKVKVEIVFPVSSESMTRTSPNSSPGIGSLSLGDVILPVIPGVASGEGCSLHGGCASCPYMKMNSLSALLKICRQLPEKTINLMPYEADRYKIQTPNGKLIADVGCEPILHMRHFQASKKLPEKLVNDILGVV